MNDTSLLHHLMELRTRLIRCILVFFAFFLLGCLFSDSLMQAMIIPVTRSLGSETPLIATQIASPVLMSFRLAGSLAFYLSLPYLLAELWAFVTPGLYPNEQKYVRSYVGLGFVLAAIGAAFAFWVILPWLFYFFHHYLPQSIRYMPDITSTFDFILSFTGIFMLVFQIPLVCFMLVKSNLCTRTQLLEYRPYVIVLAFVLGMLFTPPDVISQIILALPLWGLYELGILLTHPQFFSNVSR